MDEKQAARYSREFEHIVIDTQARPTEEDLRALAEGCDLLIVPLTPDALSLDTLFLFTDATVHGKPLQIFGEGKMQRDFTYIDDIVSGVVASIDKNYDNEIFNLGCGRKEELMDFVTMIEQACGKEAKKTFLPMQPGDVRASLADISKAKKMLGYEPQTIIKKGVPQFVEWYKNYYNI